MLHFLILSSCISYNDPLVVRSTLFNPNLYLVRGHVTQVKTEADKTVGATFEIDHVFLGPTSLKNDKFEVPSILPFTILLNVVVEPTVGEIGIWWIVPRFDVGKTLDKKNRIQYVSVAACPTVAGKLGVTIFDTFHPMRKDILDDQDYVRAYRQVERIAQDIEQIYRSSGSERIKLLEKQCRSNNEEFMFRWSKYRLERILSKKELIALYKRLLLSRCPINTELELDDSLCKLLPEWRFCEDRICIINHWMTDKLHNQEDDELTISMELDWTAGLPFVSYLDMTLNGLLSKHRSGRFKSRIANYIPYFSLTDQSAIDAGFDHLLLQLCKGSPARRAQAARLLCSFAPFTKKQQATVEVILDDPVAASLAPTLRAALENTTSFWRYLAAESDAEIPKTPLFESRLSGVLKEAFVPDIRNHHKVEPLPLLPCVFSTQLMRGFQERLRPCPAVDPVCLRQLILELDHDKFSRREKANRQIAAMGLAAEPILRRALDRTASPEVRRRLDNILTQFKAERRVTLRAIKLLAIIESTEATKLLNQLASGSPDDGITREAKKAIEAREKWESDR